MTLIKRIFFSILMLGITLPGIAQTQFSLRGNATRISSSAAGTIYRLTQAIDNQAGLITNQYAIDLSTSFTLSFDLYFGTQSAGADGIAFAISSVCSPTLGGGEGLGTDPATMNPGIVVEFDTYENGSLNDDPGSGQRDHVAAYRIDDPADRISTIAARLGGASTAAPWQPGSTLSNNAYHTVKIGWVYIGPASQRLEVYVDNNTTPRRTYTGDWLSGLFGGQNLQFWSVSGSTGSENNEHRIRYIEPNQSSSATCGGGSQMFVAPSRGSSYSWSPATYTGDGNNNDTVYVSPPTTTTYTCTYTNFCSESRTVLFQATVQNDLPEGTISGTTTQCVNTANPNITFTRTGGTLPLTFYYTVNNGAVQSVTTSGASTTATVSVPTTVAGTYTYSLTSITDGSGSNCNNPFSGSGGGSATITINPDAALTLTSAVGTDDQIVCTNTAITDIEYTGNSVVTNIAVTGLPPGITSSYAAGALTITGTATTDGVYTYTVATTGSCVQTSTTGLIRVGSTLGSGSNNVQSVCKNSPISDIIYNFSGGDTPSPSVFGLPNGLMGSVTNPGEFTLSGTPTEEGLFTYSVITNGSCNPQAILTGTINVGVGLLDASTDTQTVCKNAPITDIVYTFVGGGTPTVTGLPAGVTGAVTNPGEFTISGTPTQEGSYRYTVTTTGTCGTQSSLEGLLISGIGLMPPYVDTQAICKTDAIIDIVYNFAGGGTPTITGLPNGLSGSVTNPGEFTISGTPSEEGLFRYTVTTTGSCGTQSSLNGMITIGIGVFTTGTDTQTVCKNSPIANIIYYFVGGGTPDLSGLPAGLTGTLTSPGRFLISGTPTQEGRFIYSITTNGTCLAQSTLYGMLDIGIGLTLPGTDTQSVCKNTAITDIVYNFAGGGTPTVTGLPNGVTGTVTNSGEYTISGTPTQEGTFRYTVVTTGTCASQSTLNGMLTIGVGLAVPGTDTQTVCKDDPITNIVYNFIGGGTPIVTGLPNGVSSTVTNPGELTISGSPAEEGTFRFTVITTGTCISQSTLNGMLTVGVGLTAPGTDTQFVCKNDPITDIVYNFIGGGTPIVTGLPNGVISTVSNPGELTISGSPTEEGTFRFSVVTPGSCSSQSTLNGMLTVGLGLVTPGTDTQYVCKNSPITAIVYNIVGGASPTITGLPNGVTGLVAGSVLTISGTPTEEGTFRFSVATNGTCASQSTLNGVLTVGLGLVTPGTDTQYVCENAPITPIVYNIVGGASPTITGLPNGVNGLVAGSVLTISGTPTEEGTFRFSVATNGTCASQSTLNGMLTVGLGLVTPGTDTQYVCENAPITPIVYNIVGGTPNPSIVGLPNGVTGSVTGSVLTISGTPTQEGTFRFSVATNGTCGSKSTLNGMLTVGLGLVTPGTDTQYVCENAPITSIVYNIVGGTPNPTIIGLPDGVTGSVIGSVLTISGTPTQEGTFRFSVATNGTCSSKSTLNGMLTVGLGLVTPGTDTQYVCESAAIIPIVYNIVGGAPDPTIVGLPNGVTGSVIGSVLTISGIPTQEGTFRFSVATNGTCSSKSTLNGMLTVGLGLVTPGTDTQYVCENSPITPIVYNIVGGAPNPTITGLPNGVTGSVIGSVLTISGTPTQEGTFRISVATNGTCGSKSTLNGMLTVGLGLVTPGTDTQYVCENSPITPIVYNIVGGAPNPTIIGLPNGVTGSVIGSVLTISGTPTQEGTFRFSVATNGTCASKSTLNGMLTVGLGLVTPGTDTQYVCKSAAIIPIVYNVVGGAPNPTITGLPAGITGSVSASVLTISGSSVATGTFRYSVTTNGTCGTKSTLRGMLIMGIGVVDAAVDTQFICRDGAITDISYYLAGGGAAPSVTGLPNGLTQSVNGNIFTLSGMPTETGTFRYTVTTNGTCSQQSTLAGMIVVGAGLVTPGKNTQTICMGTALSPIEYYISDYAAPTVTGLPAGLTTSINGNKFTISGAPTQAGIFSYMLMTAGTCSPVTVMTGTVTVDNATLQLITAVSTTSQTLCTNNQIDNITYLIGGTGTGASFSVLGSGLSLTTAPGTVTISGIPDLAEGPYVFTVTPTGGTCSVTPETFTITVQNPVADFSFNNDSGTPPLPVLFSNNSVNANQYYWSFGNGQTSVALDTNITYNKTGEYEVVLIASNNGQCADTAKAIITAYKFVISNVFTPNGDNINDEFTIDPIGVAELKAEIFNRWGVKVHEWSGAGGGWDGRSIITGFNCEPGTYYYIIKAKDKDGIEYNENGFVSLIR